MTSLLIQKSELYPKQPLSILGCGIDKHLYIDIFYIRYRLRRICNHIR